MMMIFGSARPAEIVLGAPGFSGGQAKRVGSHLSRNFMMPYPLPATSATAMATQIHASRCRLAHAGQDRSTAGNIAPQTLQVQGGISSGSAGLGCRTASPFFSA